MDIVEYLQGLVIHFTLGALFSAFIIRYIVRRKLKKLEEDQDRERSSIYEIMTEEEIKELEDMGRKALTEVDLRNELKYWTDRKNDAYWLYQKAVKYRDEEGMKYFDIRYQECCRNVDRVEAKEESNDE